MGIGRISGWWYGLRRESRHAMKMGAVILSGIMVLGVGAWVVDTHMPSQKEKPSEVAHASDGLGDSAHPLLAAIPPLSAVRTELGPAAVVDSDTFSLHRDTAMDNQFVDCLTPLGLNTGATTAVEYTDTLARRTVTYVKTDALDQVSSITVAEFRDNSSAQSAYDLIAKATDSNCSTRIGTLIPSGSISYFINSVSTDNGMIFSHYTISYTKHDGKADTLVENKCVRQISVAPKSVVEVASCWKDFPYTTVNDLKSMTLDRVYDLLAHY